MADDVRQTAVKTWVVSPEGTVGSVPDAELAQAKREGFKELSPEESIRAAGQAVADSGIGSLVAGTTGALRGATAGLSDVALVKGAGLYGVTPEAAADAIQSSKAAHEGLSLATEAGGMFLMPGVGELGGLAGRGVTRLVGAGAEAVIPRALQAAARTAAQVGVENAFFSAGQHVSEEVLGDPNAGAEKLLAAAGKGALIGGAEGAALGGLAGLGGSLLLSGGKAALGKAAEKLGNSSLSETLLGERNVQAFRSTGAKTGDYKKLGATAAAKEERIQQLGSRMHEEDIVGPFKSRAEMAETTTAKLKEASTQLGDSVKGLNKAKARPDALAIAKRVEEEVIAPLRQDIGKEHIADQVQSWVKEFTNKAPNEAAHFEGAEGAVDFDRLWNIRKDLDKELAWGKGGTPPRKVEEFREVRRIIEDEFQKSADRAAGELGATFADDYKMAKARYGDLKTINDILGHEVGRDLSNQTWSLGDKVAATAGGLAGAATGGVGGLVAGGLASVANYAARNYGRQLASHVLDKAAQLTSLQKSIRLVDSRVESGVGALLKPEAYPVLPKAGRSAAETTKAIDLVRDAAANPAAVTSRVQKVIGRIGDAAPKAAAVMATTAAAAITYLSNAAPKGRVNTASLQPLAQKPRYTQSELDAFAQKLEGVENPMSILTDMRAGSLSRDKVDAVRAVYPALFKEIQYKAALAVAASPHPLGWEQQKQLSVLLGVPTDDTLDPGFVSRMQESLSAQQQGGQAPGAAPATNPNPAGAKRPVERYADNSGMTSADRIAR